MSRLATLDTHLMPETTVTATTSTTVSENESENETVTIEREIGGTTTTIDSQRTGTHGIGILATCETHAMFEIHTFAKGREITGILATETFATRATFVISEIVTHEMYVIHATQETRETCGIRGTYVMCVIAEMRTHHDDRTTADRSRVSRFVLITAKIERYLHLKSRRQSWSSERESRLDQP